MTKGKAGPLLAQQARPSDPRTPLTGSSNRMSTMHHETTSGQAPSGNPTRSDLLKLASDQITKAVESVTHEGSRTQRDVLIIMANTLADLRALGVAR